MCKTIPLRIGKDPKQQKALEDLIGRIYNWKFKQAAHYVKKAIPNDPTLSSQIFVLGGILGNCGWPENDFYSPADIEINRWVEDTLERLDKLRD